jgi:hypothetical protein
MNLHELLVFREHIVEELERIVESIETIRVLYGLIKKSDLDVEPKSHGTKIWIPC